MDWFFSIEKLKETELQAINLNNKSTYPITNEQNSKPNNEKKYKKQTVSKSICLLNNENENENSILFDEFNEKMAEEDECDTERKNYYEFCDKLTSAKQLYVFVAFKLKKYKNDFFQNFIINNFFLKYSTFLESIELNNEIDGKFQKNKTRIQKLITLLRERKERINLNNKNKRNYELANKIIIDYLNKKKNDHVQIKRILNIIKNKFGVG